MKLYVSGPMSGVPLWNWPAFDAATVKLLDEGHEPVNPAHLDEEAGLVEATRDDLGVVAVVVPSDFDFRTAIARDLDLIDGCDGIYLLEGWHDSLGARIEWAYAKATGKTLLFEGGQYETVLEEAQRLIHGNRHEDYGPPADDFSRTAQMWNALWGTDLDAADVALGMICVKLSREAHRPKRDNLTDIAGYAGCLEMVRERERQA